MSIQLNVKMAGQTKEEYIRSVIETSKQIFNAEIGYEFFKDCNLKVAFCNSNNQASVYEDLCGQFFPLYLAECYSRVNFFKAQVLTNADEGIYGILICLDTDEEPDEWYQIILHEMSHIFCIVHEYGGENFTDKYSESKFNNRDQFIMVSHGYAIWREFIAYYMAYRINPLERPLSLTELRNIVRRLDDGVLEILTGGKKFHRYLRIFSGHPKSGLPKILKLSLRFLKKTGFSTRRKDAEIIVK